MQKMHLNRRIRKTWWHGNDYCVHQPLYPFKVVQSLHFKPWGRRNNNFYTKTHREGQRDKIKQKERGRGGREGGKKEEREQTMLIVGVQVRFLMTIRQYTPTQHKIYRIDYPGTTTVACILILYHRKFTQYIISLVTWQQQTMSTRTQRVKTANVPLFSTSSSSSFSSSSILSVSSSSRYVWSIFTTFTADNMCSGCHRNQPSHDKKLALVSDCSQHGTTTRGPRPGMRECDMVPGSRECDRDGEPEQRQKKNKRKECELKVGIRRQVYL